jgi:endonuclease-3
VAKRTKTHPTLAERKRAGRTRSGRSGKLPTQTPAHAAQVVKGLKQEYPLATCALVHDTPFELLIATILSAQCTDERVNIVTKELFARCPTPAQMAALPIADLEKAVQSTGFFRNKAKNIHECCVKLVEEHGGQVPRELVSLVKLPGVGRKTANVVLGTAYRIPSGVVVDTHVTRLCAAGAHEARRGEDQRT